DDHRTQHHGRRARSRADRHPASEAPCLRASKARRLGCPHHAGWLVPARRDRQGRRRNGAPSERARDHRGRALLPSARRRLGGGAPIPPKVMLESLVSRATPPCFIMHAADDGAVPVERSLTFFSALKAANVPVEMHIFDEGGHGFGIGLVAGKPAEAWPDL